MPSLRRSVILLMTFSCAVSARAAPGDWSVCGGRLERALDTLRRESSRRNRLDDDEAGAAYQQELRSAPLEMTVSRMAVKLPQTSRVPGGSWARVERCVYEPTNNSLRSRVVFDDLTVSGVVSLTPRDRLVPIPAESCRMTLRLRRSGIEFFTSPIARGRGQMRIRTESSFLEPRFAAIYAYGCRPTRGDKQIKRQDKWPPRQPFGDELTVLPAPLTDDYEAAEPRQLVGIAKEVDVPIPNESRQSHALHQPVTAVGMWKKNFWVTKSPLRRRRSYGDATTKQTSGNGSGTPQTRERDAWSSNRRKIANEASRSYEQSNSYLDKTNENDTNEYRTIPRRIDDPLRIPTHADANFFPDFAARVRRSAEVITPQDFATALAGKKRPATDDANEVAGNGTARVNETLVWSNATNDLPVTEHLDDCERNSSFERERDSLEGTSESAPRETRDLLVDENPEEMLAEGLDDPGRSWQSREHVAREMEDVFLRSASQALTRYIERQLHPAIKETLMLSMGYTISYG